ncbi:hypothetical protein GCM10007304_11830 [Rhodococcoides trifolii]|uniref:AbiEi antitoxin C-terminal domain-containing protein n=1 Tax=Rhodococcoides trifolii TaxID=908250 RepID=A0A917CW22_9NOCA|nr:type IV toxin-antitoxin system AbiEi family antitoxin [Rhodococcus trifolii]GGF99587.1 hypothetical protein GCM10007304_11830 [Rhodococcus trifolii]
MDYLTRRAALAAGITDQQLRTARMRGERASILRGCTVIRSDWDALAAHEQYAVTVRAFADAGISGVLSHESAAALHGLALLRPDRSRIHESADGRGGGTTSSRRKFYRFPLAPEDCTVVDSIPVTTPARTALDIACRGTFDQAVCAVESALRLGADFVEPLERLGRRHGLAMVRRAVDFASPLTESIGESWSRALMTRWPEVPAPRLQHAFMDRRGAIGRTDFDWEDMVGEFDGLSKYGNRSSLVKEKLREDRLRALGLHVVRWVWSDLTHPERLRRILRDGFALLESRSYIR